MLGRNQGDPKRFRHKKSLRPRIRSRRLDTMSRHRKNQLYTAGHEGLNAAEFLAALKNASVTVLFDVRDRPQSRKPGFSKNSLAAECERVGIRYLHNPKLGTPPDQMEDMRAAGEYTPEIFERYRDYLLQQGESLDHAVQLATDE